jgi:hypothetical protein
MDITIKLSVDMVNVVLNALAEVPYKFSHNVITQIQMQAAGQVNPPSEPPPAPEPAPETPTA